jgi:hypothetical protein
MSSAKSTRYSAMVLQNSANSFFMQLHLLFPGLWPCNIGVFYISLSINTGAGSSRVFRRCSSAASMGCILAAGFEQSLMKS